MARAPTMISTSAARSAMPPGVSSCCAGELGGAPPRGAICSGGSSIRRPRVALGQALRGLASACIDVSDGLYVDALRLLRASHCGATLELSALPLSAPLRELYGERAATLALTGGEDYELCFTAPARHRSALRRLSRRLRLPIARIGSVRRGRGGLQLRGLDGNSVTQFSALAFDHFGRGSPPQASARAVASGI